jgi:hypothetical protein
VIKNDAEMIEKRRHDDSNEGESRRAGQNDPSCETNRWSAFSAGGNTTGRPHHRHNQRSRKKDVHLLAMRDCGARRHCGACQRVV